MNTEQVIEMIDAITEGGEYEKFELNGEQINIAIRDDEFVIAGLSNDPRTAREIAAALVAWANRKDGMMNGSVRAILGDIRWSEVTIQDEFEKLHRELHETPDIPENKEKLQKLLDQIQYLRENGAKDFESDV